MAARPVMMTGVLYPMNKMDPPVPCSFVGNAWDPSLSIGGGPMPGGPGEPGIPTFPIAGYPDFPYPSQPIYRPGYPGGSPPPSFPLPPDLPGVTPPPDNRPIDWKVQVVWTPTDGWSTIIVGKPTGPTPTPSVAKK